MGRVDLSAHSVGLLVLTLVASACNAVPAPSPSAVPPTSTASPSPSAASADEVFERVAPSIVYVATDVGTGSALVIDDRHVLTSAHVIRPYRSARLVLADASRVPDADVVAWDLHANLAILDAGTTIDAPGLSRSTAAGRRGERVFLVGYPLANTTSPTATITEGIISGAPFEWTDGLTFHQTDAVIEDGQSDGVLVDGSGALLDITGGSRGRFAVALDAADAFARVDRLIAGDDVDGIDERLLPDPGAAGRTDFDVVIRHRADVHVWVVHGGTGAPPVELTLKSDRPVGLYGMAAAGRLGHGAGPPAKELRLSIPFEANRSVRSEDRAGRRAPGERFSPLERRADAVRGHGRRPIDRRRLAARRGRRSCRRPRLVPVRRQEGRQGARQGVIGLGRPSAFHRPGWRRPAAARDGHDDGGPLGVDDVVDFAAPADGEYLIGSPTRDSWGPARTD